MSDNQLTALLAVRVLGWRIAQGRFIKANRAWCPQWRFDPLQRIADAFELLERSGYQYTLTLDAANVFTAEVRSVNRKGLRRGEEKPRTITLAIADAAGLETPK